MQRKLIIKIIRLIKYSFIIKILIKYIPEYP
jgi:hypothetical protein